MSSELQHYGGVNCTQEVPRQWKRHRDMGGQGGQPVQDGEDLGDLRSLSIGHCYPIKGHCVAYMKPNLPGLNPIWGI